MRREVGALLLMPHRGVARQHLLNPPELELVQLGGHVNELLVAAHMAHAGADLRRYAAGVMLEGTDEVSNHLGTPLKTPSTNWDIPSVNFPCIWPSVACSYALAIASSRGLSILPKPDLYN